MPVELQIADAHVNESALKRLDLQACLDAIAGVTGDPRLAGELCVKVCDECESRHLNNTYRQKDQPTNVLSFAGDSQLSDISLLGDLAICWEVVKQEAERQGKNVVDHFYHLFVHGVFHLLGHDHEQPAQAEQMETLERQVLAQLNIADPYREVEDG